MRQIVLILFLCINELSFVQYTHNFEYSIPKATTLGIVQLNINNRGI